jgi:hypothetical protein
MPEAPADYDEEEPHFKIYRMVPPGKLSYFFSIGENNYMIQTGKEIKTKNDEINPINKNRKVEVALGPDKKISLNVPRLNYIDGDINLCK